MCAIGIPCSMLCMVCVLSPRTQLRTYVCAYPEHTYMCTKARDTCVVTADCNNYCPLQSAKEGQRAVPPPPPPVVCSPTHKREYSPRDATLPSTLSKTHTPHAPPPTRSPGGLIVGEGSMPFFSGDGSECHLTMHRGALAEDDADYVEFQRANQAEWGR